jgi:hypothetical protein
MSRAQHRDRQKEQFWHEAVTAWQKSGQSVRAFCADRAPGRSLLGIGSHVHARASA